MSPTQCDMSSFAVSDLALPLKNGLRPCVSESGSPTSTADAVAVSLDALVQGTNPRQGNEEFTEEERSVAEELASLGGFGGRAVASQWGGVVGRPCSRASMWQALDAPTPQRTDKDLPAAMDLVRQYMQQQGPSSDRVLADLAAALAAANAVPGSTSPAGSHSSSAACLSSAPNSPHCSGRLLVQAPGTPDNTNNAASSSGTAHGADGAAAAAVPHMDLPPHAAAIAAAATAVAKCNQISSMNISSYIHALQAAYEASRVQAAPQSRPRMPNPHPATSSWEQHLGAQGRESVQPATTNRMEQQQLGRSHSGMLLQGVRLPTSCSFSALHSSAPAAAKRRRLEHQPSGSLLAAAQQLLGSLPAAADDWEDAGDAAAPVALTDDIVNLLMQRGLSAAIEHAAASKAAAMLQEAAAAMASGAIHAASAANSLKAAAGVAGPSRQVVQRGGLQLRAGSGAGAGHSMPRFPSMHSMCAGPRQQLVSRQGGMPQHVLQPRHQQAHANSSSFQLPAAGQRGAAAPAPVARPHLDGFRMRAHGAMPAVPHAAPAGSARPLAPPPAAGPAADPDPAKRATSNKSVHHRVSRFPIKLQQACRRVWEQEGRVRVVCNGMYGELSVLEGRCMVVYEVGGLCLMRNVAEYLRAANEWRIKKWRRHVKVPDFMRPFGKIQEPLTVEEFLCIVGFQPDTGRAAGAKRNAAAADIGGSPEPSS